MKVKFSRCNSNSLTNVPQVDGQLIYVKDTNEVYMDVGNNRNKISDVIEVADITNVQNPIISKIYYDEATENLYKYIDNEWKSLGGNVTPQIYFWDNTETQEEIVEFWNTVVNATKNTQVIVYNNVSNSNSSYSGYVYFKKGQFTNQMTQYEFSFTPHKLDVNNYTNYSQHREWRIVVQLTLNNTIVTNVGQWTYNDTVGYLRVDYDYSAPYTPQFNGSPVTKKYMEDSLATFTPESSNTSFDNTGTSFTSTNVEDVIKEIDTKLGTINDLLDDINGEEV